MDLETRVVAMDDILFHLSDIMNAIRSRPAYRGQSNAEILEEALVEIITSLALGEESI
jgi:hypothetical protein